MFDIYGRIIAKNQQIYLNTGRLWGINSLNVSPTLGASPLIYLGIQNKPVNQILSSEQFTELSINSNLINYDPFIQYTGADCFNMFILQNQSDLINNYCLISGYLSSYSLKFSIGQPVQISTSIRFINNGGRIPLSTMDPTAYSTLAQIPSGVYEDTERKFHVASFESTSLTLNDYNTQRIIDANIEFKISRIPIYNIGNKIPSKINIVYPIKVNCGFTIEINPSYSGIELQSFPANKQVENITFNLYENNNAANLITTFGLSGMTVTNEVYQASTEGNVKITKQYEGYIFN